MVSSDYDNFVNQKLTTNNGRAKKLEELNFISPETRQKLFEAEINDALKLAGLLMSHCLDEDNFTDKLATFGIDAEDQANIYYYMNGWCELNL